MPIAASRLAHMGGTAGFPNIGLQGFSPKLAKGEIASLSGAADDALYFQISVPVQPGNSGGALVDEHGNVVGIVSAKLDASLALAASGALPENVNYAVKSREGRHVAVPNFRDADTASLPSSNPCRRFRPG